MSDADASLARAYDQTHYRGHAYPDTHPDNLRTRALLAGIDAPPVTNCRVLEIGCGIGTNLLPMAQSLPGSHFVGIDISESQIAAARSTATTAGITNIQLRCQDLLDMDVEQQQREPFDYIIAHGVYSWVPPAVREKLLLVCRRLLTPTGIAYISYNTLPGWRLKQIARDVMRFRTRDGGATSHDDPARLTKARQALDFAAQPCPAPLAYKEVLARLKQEISTAPDWYLLHEQLEPTNEPVYFEQFANQAAQHRLNYVGSATSRSELSMHILPPAMRQQIESLTDDPTAREQYLDFLTGKMFRQSLLCRDDAPRADPSRFDPLEVIGRLHVAGRLTESGSSHSAAPNLTPVLLAGRHNDNKLALTDPSEIAAFRAVAAAWPHAVSVEALTSHLGRHFPALAGQIFTAFHAGIVDLWSRPTDFFATSSSYPRVTPLARLQAASHEPMVVVNLCHEEVTLDAPSRQLLSLLDGSRTHAELATALQFPQTAVDQLLHQCCQMRMCCRHSPER